MSAYIIVDLSSIDNEKLKQYGTEAAETLASFGGEFLVKRPIEVLHGTAKLPTKVIIEFPDRERASGWYHSPAYQAVIDLRDQTITSQFHLVG